MGSGMSEPGSAKSHTPAGRARNNGWYTYDGPDSVLNSQIDQAITPVGLDPTVGLIEFEWRAHRYVTQQSA